MTLSWGWESAKWLGGFSQRQSYAKTIFQCLKFSTTADFQVNAASVFLGRNCMFGDQLKGTKKVAAFVPKGHFYTLSLNK